MPDAAQRRAHLTAIEPSDPTFRRQPQNAEAEQALLGAILVNNDAALKVNSFLRPEHFVEPVNARIFDAILRLIERGHLADPVTLKGYFDRDDALTPVGGTSYLAQLAAAAVTVINAEDYGRAIYDLAIRRQLITIGETMVNTAYDSTVEETAVSQIEESERQLFNLAQAGQSESGFKSFTLASSIALENAEAAYKRDGQLSGVTTGFVDIDERLGGLHRSDLLILAGRPSMGKTALATNIAFNAAYSFREEVGVDGRPVVVEGAAVAFFSLEMSAEQLATRILAERSNIPSERIRRGNISSEQFTNLTRAAHDLEQLRLYIDDTPALSIAALATRARRLKRTHNIGLIVVDYLQLLRPARQRRDDNRVLEVSEITQGLKALAKQLDVPVLALSQLSRAVEQREDKRPHLADLRESGSIEQDADVVMFIYREEYYLDRQRPPEGTPERIAWEAKRKEVEGLAELIVGKHRHGPTGTEQLLFHGETTKFANLAKTGRLPSHAPF
ncbi:MAG: replicative DNA helicase [Alphaproteobacteria bacterium]|nr:replicative DNA helicase [Alphaproteobacteria bacterium]